MKKIGYLGPVGTFTEEAARSYTRGDMQNLLAYPDIQELMLAVDQGELDKCVVPVENALEGTVNITVDMLVHEVDLKIVGEIILPISHCLLARPGVDINNIEVLISHPQALAQCRKYIHSYLPGIDIRPAASTAAGAREVMESDMTWAAIGNRRAASTFGLDILSENIQDHMDNCTKFIILSKDEAGPTGQDKTSVAFTVDDSPGSLYHALNIFAVYEINLKKIESRPMRTLLGQYLFLVDFEGHTEDKKIKNALSLLSNRSKYFKHLGSYPRC